MTETMSFIDRVRARVESGATSYATTAVKRRMSRDVVKTNMFDNRQYAKQRQNSMIDALIDDLRLGDEHKGGQRGAFDGSGELVKAVFNTFYKAAPALEHKRNLERDLYPAHRIVKEIMDNPKIGELQGYTASDPMMATMAVDAMADDLREILGRLPPPPQPPGDGPGEGGSGGDKFTQQPQGGGQGQPDPNAQPDPNGTGQQPGGQGQGQGQPDPNAPPQQGQGGGQQPGEAEEDPNGQPQQPQQGSGEGESTAEHDDGSSSQQDLVNEEDGGAEFEEETEEQRAEREEAEWEAAYDEALDGMELDRRINHALDKAVEDAEELQNLRKGIGLEDGEWKSMDPEQRLVMAERLRTPEMKALASIVGRMKRFASAIKATRINDVPHEAYDVETGNNLRHVLKPQFVFLANPATKVEFYRQYANRELLQFKLRGKEEVGKGPIVMCVDKSGSMSGSPANWALGLAEALRRFAAEDDRDLHVLFFGNNDDRVRFDFPKGKAPFEKVLAFLGTQSDGGTQFDGVLTEALGKASTAFDGEGKGKADIVFVTDGMANLDASWIKGFNEERERTGVRMYSIYVGGARDMSSKTGPTALLGKISDAVIPVSELKPESARLVFERV